MPDMRADISGIDNQQRAQSTTADAAKTRGSFNGAEVQLIDMNSLMMNAAEEMTSELSEDMEKEVSEREVEDGKKSESLERLMQLAEVNEALKSLGDLDKQALQRAIKALLEHQSSNARELREKAREQFEEPAHQYVALKALAEALKARGADKAQIEAAEGALNSLLTEEGPAIRAAINIGPTASDFAGSDLGDIQSLRDAYRTNIRDYKSMSGVLNDLIERFGEADVKKSIQFMTKALAADLEAGGSSIEKSKLNLILNDMHRLKTLTTMLGHCDILATKAHENGASSSFTPVHVLRELVPLQDAIRIVPDHVAAIPEKAGLSDLGKQINFLNDFKEMARLIPIKSFAREEGREKLMDAIQQALDEKIDLEEQEEDIA